MKRHAGFQEISGACPLMSGISITALTLALTLALPGSGAAEDKPRPSPPPGPAYQQGGIPLPLTDSSVEIVTGRVAHLTFGNEVTGLRVTKQPEEGRVTVNPDGTLAAVMTETDHLGPLPFTTELTLRDGSTRSVTTKLQLIAGGPAAGWGLGAFYQLPTDAQGRSVIEHGAQHRLIHVSGNHGALSIEAIATREGLAPKKISGKWLAQHPQYGSSPALALSAAAARVLWQEIASAGPNSHWLLFERGYRYDEVLDLTGVRGESPLHPVLITAYGEGQSPVLGAGIRGIKDNIGNIVLQDLAVTSGFGLHSGQNMLIENVEVTGATINLQNMTGLTLRGSASLDAFNSHPRKTDKGIWSPSPNRMSGLFVKNSNGILIEGNLFDHAGWGEGYDYDLAAMAPQPPSFYSHNVYLQRDSLDITFRDNISMRGASFGAQIRPSGFIEDNVFLDNNAGVNFFSGIDKKTGIPSGNYALFMGNLITSGAHKEVAQKQGALTMGVNYNTHLPVLTGNIITHLADPANREEQAEKYVAHAALKGSPPYYDDTIVHDWLGAKDRINVGKPPRNPDQNTETLDPAILDRTTIQNFTAERLGRDSASIDDLGKTLRAEVAGEPAPGIDAQQILGYFREGFGLAKEPDLDAPAQRFVPSDLGEGMRWDNRLNWNQGYLPREGQDIDLGGNRVYYAGAGTLDIGDLALGEDGSLVAGAGKLTVTGRLIPDDGASGIEIGNAGQVWIEASAGPGLLSIDVAGGRLANQGEMSGPMEISVSDGQVLLAAGAGRFDLTDGSRLEITGQNARIGFDGQNGAVGVLRMAPGARLSFIAEETGLSPISEFRSGAFGETPSDSQSGITLAGTLSVDLAPLALGVTELTLISADEIAGDFDSVSIIGFGSSRDATLLIDYVNDTVTLSLTAGTGKIIRQTRGDAADRSDIKAELWQAMNGA
jgi:hypothetical protein